MRWSSHLVEHPSELEERVLELQGADLLLAFCTPDWLPGLPATLHELRSSGARVVGCTGGGVLAEGTESEDEPGLALLAGWLPDVAVLPFQVPVARLDQPWWEDLGVVPEHEPVFLLFPEPHTVDATHVLERLDEAFPGAVKLGGLASGARSPGGNALFVDQGVYSGGMVGVVLYGDVVADPIVAQGCRPIGPPMRVTRSDRNMVLHLDGAPAVATLESIYDQLDEADRRRFGASPMIGLAPPTRGLGGYLVRHILGLDRAAGAIAVSALVEQDQIIQLHLRDPDAARDELSQLLQSALRPDHQAALMFTCLGRGQHFYGAPDVDSRLVLDAADVALAGFFANGELGPLQRRTHLHSHTSSLALFRKRGWS